MARSIRASSGLAPRAIKHGYSNFDQIQTDADFDPIRGDVGFRELFRLGKLDRRYDVLWLGSSNYTSVESHGLDPVAHLQHVREWLAQGYRPAALSVTWTTDEPFK